MYYQNGSFCSANITYFEYLSLMIEILTPYKLIKAFSALGNYLIQPDEELQHLIDSASNYNAWFTSEQTANAVNSIGMMLNKADLTTWIENSKPLTYNLQQPACNRQPKSVGLVLAGNIPLVGLHDILCVLASGNRALIKLSSQDKLLLPHIIAKLIDFEPVFANQIVYLDRLENFDAVISTGSNNTSRYFEYYFAKVPHIIRKNRNSVAVLSGNESRADLNLLGKDIFGFFGLGCRNVSKIYVPEEYIFNTFFESIESFNTIGNHHKYNNNYDYNKSIYLINGEQHLDNGFLLLKQDENLASPLAVLYYETYQDVKLLEEKLELMKAQIQVIVSNTKLVISAPIVKFGQSQQPKLWDYADGIDTMEFLTGLN